MAQESNVDTGIDATLVRHIAHLARLKMDESEVDEMARELSTIVEYIDQLSAVDTTDVPPTAHALPVQNVFREDEVRSSLPVEQALSNAPMREGEFFRVPKILGDDTGA